MLEQLAHAKTFAVVTLGCKVNRVESDTLSAALVQRGLVSVQQSEADLIVVNTCTVTGDADKKARKAVRAALRQAPDACIVATGCATAIRPDTFLNLSERVVVIDRIQLIHELTNMQEESSVPLRIGKGFRTRVGIKAQDGCNNACTYCIVHTARGPARSMPFQQVIQEASTYFEAGVKEVVLTGIDLGAYSFEGHSLAELTSRLLECARQTQGSADFPARIRLSSIEPLSIDDELIELLAQSNGQLCRHLHLPLQSGSSKVLAEMARPYTAEGFLALVERLYAAIPELSLSTDIICGFPGETERDFEETLQLARSARFSKIHVFPYSRRAGTPAAARNDQLPPGVIAQRAATLRALAQELREYDRSRRSGAQELVLIEGATGLTESYHQVALEQTYPAGSLTYLALP